jgi:hypothetical protein
MSLKNKSDYLSLIEQKFDISVCSVRHWSSSLSEKATIGSAFFWGFPKTIQWNLARSFFVFFGKTFS